MLELENAYELELDLEDEDFDEEWEEEDFLEGEYEGEYESEEIFGWLKKKAKSIARKVAPALKRIAPMAARAVGTAVGGPGVGAALGRTAGLLAREDEFDYELDGEFDYELDGEFDYELDGESDYEYELEDEYESEFELMMADVYSDLAAKASSELEAEALVGAATAKVLPKSPPVQKVSHRIIKGGATLAKVLRKSPRTRPLVPVVPLVARRTGKNLAKQAAKGKKITPKVAAKTMATQTKKVLSSPMTCAKAVVKASQKKKKVVNKLGKSAKYY